MNRGVSLSTVKFPNLDIQHYKKLSSPRFLNALSIATINHHIRYDIARKAYLKRIISLKTKIQEHQEKETDLPLTGMDKKLSHHVSVLMESIIPNLKYLSNNELQELVKLTVSEDLITQKDFVVKRETDLQSYNLETLADSIVPFGKYSPTNIFNFFEGLKCSYKTSTGKLFENVSEKMIKHFEPVAKEVKHTKLSGEQVTTTKYEIKYDKLLSVNKINDEIFTKPELQNFIKTFVHFCPVQHLDPLVYYFKENVVKTFSSPAHLSVLEAILERLTLEQYRHSETLRFLSVNHNNNRSKNLGYKALLSKHEISELKYNKSFVDKFKKNLLGKILVNAQVDSEVKKDFLKKGGVINKSDILAFYEAYFRSNRDVVDFVKARENKFDIISERTFSELLP